jgi:prepilin-type N-terminal cleavage/methylation domain-containing protein/prepilin-type processing-associated H-X9-DG protein
MSKDSSPPPILRVAGSFGFTVIELLAVVVIIGVLAAMLIPMGLKAKDAAYRVKCLGNLKQLSAAHAAYLTDHDGTFPFYMAYGGFVGSGYLWQLLLPYVDENPSVFRCPADKRQYSEYAEMSLLPGTTDATKAKLMNLCSYASNDYLTGGYGNYPVEYAFAHGLTKMQQVTTPASQLVLFTDSDLEGTPYLSIGRGIGTFSFNKEWPTPSTTRHGKGCMIAFLDGHIEHVSTSEAPATWLADFQSITYQSRK